MKKILTIILLMSSVTSWAYTLSDEEISSISRTVGWLRDYTQSWPANKKTLLWEALKTKTLEKQDQLSQIQTSTASAQNAWYEGLRRELSPDSFVTEDVIFDDQVGTILTRAPRGIRLHYYPSDTPTFRSVSESLGSTIVNGSYFSRNTIQSHSGLLWDGENALSPMIRDDAQLTHIVCEKNTHFSIIPNHDLNDAWLLQCDLAFQAGPLIYQRTATKLLQETLATTSYIGQEHNRTILVIMDHQDGSQEVWIMTVMQPITLKEARNIILREARFQGTYQTITLFNLDGGSSVAYRNPAHPELNFGSDKRLPIIFEL